MVPELTTLIACQFAGEVLARGAGLPLPGPVIGLVILLIGLGLRGGVGAGMHAVSSWLLRNLGLLFVPAGVGVVTQLPVIAANSLAIAATILGSTALGLLVTGLVMQRLSRPRLSRPRLSRRQLSRPRWPA